MGNAQHREAAKNDVGNATGHDAAAGGDNRGADDRGGDRGGDDGRRSGDAGANRGNRDGSRSDATADRGR